MNTTYHYSFVLVVIISLSPLLAGAVALMQNHSAAPKSAELTLADARAPIGATYVRWGRARVGIDRKALDVILAPDFYVSMYGRKISRDTFLNEISTEFPDRRLTRFDVDVLTVRKTDWGWTAVIAEKIEYSISGSSGEKQKQCGYWVTRDGFSHEGDKWLITFSEVIGHERWAPGETLPIEDW